MSTNVFINLTNKRYKTDLAGYCEIHDIKHLNSPEHALDTVKNVIDRNINYTENNCPLVSVIIQCTDRETYKLIKEYYDKYADDLEVYISMGAD